MGKIVITTLYWTLTVYQTLYWSSTLIWRIQSNAQKIVPSLFLTTALYIRPVNTHFKSEQHTQLIDFRVLSQTLIYPTPDFIGAGDLAELKQT